VKKRTPTRSAELVKSKRIEGSQLTGERDDHIRLAKPCWQPCRSVGDWLRLALAKDAPRQSQGKVSRNLHSTSQEAAPGSCHHGCDWWQFVTQDSYQPGFDVDIDQAIFLKDWVMGATEFARWGGTQQFLQERRSEIRQLPAFAAFVSKLREVSNETATLQNKVKTNIV